MIKAVTSIIEQSMSEFLKALSESHKIPFDELQSIWEDHKNSVTNAAENTTSSKNRHHEKKKSAYQRFFAIKTVEIKKTDPHRPFGELSKDISKLWNGMSKEEQSAYSEISKDENDSESFTKDQLSAMKMSDLKKLCEKKKVRKSGNKTELINNLLLQSSEEVTKPVEPILLKRSTIVLDDMEDDNFIGNEDTIHYKRSEIEDDQSLFLEEDDEEEIDYDDVIEDLDDD